MSDLQGGAPVNGYPTLDSRADPAATPVPVPGYATAGGGGHPAPGDRASLDHGLVRELRRQVAERLAARLQATPDLPVDARRELGRSLVAQVLEARARERARAGEPHPGAAEEYALAEAVMAALFGMGRLQPLV